MNLHLNSVLIYTCMYLLINYQVIEWYLVLYKVQQKVLSSPVAIPVLETAPAP